MTRRPLLIDLINVKDTWFYGLMLRLTMFVLFLFFYEYALRVTCSCQLLLSKLLKMYQLYQLSMKTLATCSDFQ